MFFGLFSFLSVVRMEIRLWSFLHSGQETRSCYVYFITIIYIFLIWKKLWNYMDSIFLPSQKILTYLHAFVRVHLMQKICDRCICRNDIRMGKSKFLLFLFQKLFAFLWACIIMYYIFKFKIMKNRKKYKTIKHISGQ